ncbi:SDR family oxidoreductase [Aliarcobacter butzleri]|uniref:SDR family NAD(P)-dependent oxidoreductase n=1 Tax=Aliarcobacter butzleri TaxID=28197 RepID=UPI0021B175B8|nr:SDR family oxidoreductase [Aliarcobacter butzleri]MCT7635620.1 SDR family oxidoreductase [Aliarcobacter butzleri]
MKNVLITGSSRGIGKSISMELRDNGYNCITPSRNELDISCVKSINQYINSLNISIDCLVNCAGINILRKINEIDEKDISSMLNANLIAPLFLIQSVSEQMKEKKYGKIVNVSSIWGVRSKEFRTLYSMTKFGINGLTKSLSRELGEYNILVNSIAPGYVNTEMTKKNVPIEEQEKIKETIPLKRFAEPSEIAKLVSFLLSENNSYITGQTIIIDGGFLA